jgi:hypothetical protein
MAPRPEADFLCVLEDDNYWFPEHLKDNICKLQRVPLIVVHSPNA